MNNLELLPNHRDVINHPEYKEFVTAVLDNPIGYTFLHSEIGEIMMIKPLTSKYRTQVTRANKALLQYSRQLLSIRGEGYRVIGSDGMVELSLKLVEKSKGRAESAMKILENVKREDLTDENQLKFDMIVLKVTQLYASLTGGLVEAKIIHRRVRKINTD